MAIAGTGLQPSAQDFVTRMFRNVPDWLPAGPSSLHPPGAALVLVALALAREGTQAALVLAALFLVAILCLHLPSILGRPSFGGIWTNPGVVVFFQHLAAARRARTGRNPDRQGASRAGLGLESEPPGAAPFLRPSSSRVSTSSTGLHGDPGCLGSGGLLDLLHRLSPDRGRRQAPPPDRALGGSPPALMIFLWF